MRAKLKTMICNMGASCSHWLIRLVIRIRFGEVKAICRETHGGQPCEIEYQNSKGEVVGYWSYGYFDPRLPYKG